MSSSFVSGCEQEKIFPVESFDYGIRTYYLVKKVVCGLGNYCNTFSILEKKKKVLA